MRRNILLTAMVLAGVGMGAGHALAADAQLEVYGLTTKKHLNLRSGPSLQDTVIGGLVAGEMVKNLGCKDGWCHVETKGGAHGYSYQDFLKEAASMVETAPAMAAPPRFALGKLKCERNNGSPIAECDYGVMRIGSGARLQVTWPDATKRTFGVFGPAVTTGDGSVRAQQTADGSYDVTLTPKGQPSEHYIVPVSVVTGK